MSKPEHSAGQGPDLPVKDASKPSGRTTPAPAESDTPLTDRESDLLGGSWLVLAVRQPELKEGPNG